MSQIGSVVGKRVPRWGAAEKATGAAQYIGDIRLPGMLVGKVLTSPHPHARIVKIDKSRAESLTGVAAVLTFEDIPRKLYTPNRHDLILHNPENECKDMYVLSDKARFVGGEDSGGGRRGRGDGPKGVGAHRGDVRGAAGGARPDGGSETGAVAIHDFRANNISLHLNFPRLQGRSGKGVPRCGLCRRRDIPHLKTACLPMEPSSRASRTSGPTGG